eukprot:479173_1
MDDEKYCFDRIANKFNYPFIYCWITSNGITDDPTNFNFKFNLYIQDQFQRLNVHKFKTTWRIIRKLHKKAFGSHTLFAQMRFPRVLDETKAHRNAQLPNLDYLVRGFIREMVHDMNCTDNSIFGLCIHYFKGGPHSIAIENTLNFMDDVLMINSDIKTIHSFDDEIEGGHVCLGPGRTGSFLTSSRLEATPADNDAVSHFLCQIFNSPAFITTQPRLFSDCGIANNLKDAVQEKALMLLQKMRLMTMTRERACRTWPHLKADIITATSTYDRGILRADEWKDVQFHTLYLCTRKKRGNKLSLMDHWTLKFEGNQWLFTLEWFGTSEFFIKFQPNDCLGQRAFWFSWTNSRRQLFTQRWGTLNGGKIYIQNGGITAGKIGDLLHKWLSYCEYRGFEPLYNSMRNNCQHFVRDFVSVFNVNVAEYLTTQFHHRQVEKIMTPSGALSNDWDEYSRIQEVRRRLTDAHVHIRRPHTRSFKEVRDWLNEIGKSEYYDVFIQNGYDAMNAVKVLKKNHLKQMGITKLGHVELIWDEVLKLNTEVSDI